MVELVQVAVAVRGVVVCVHRGSACSVGFCFAGRFCDCFLVVGVCAWYVHVPAGKPRTGNVHWASVCRVWPNEVSRRKCTRHEDRGFAGSCGKAHSRRCAPDFVEVAIVWMLSFLVFLVLVFDVCVVCG